MRRRRGRGFILPLAVLMCFLMILIAFVLQDQARQQLRFATNRLRAEQCQGAADAGLALALSTLATNSAYAGQETAVTLGEGPETYTIKLIKSPNSMPDGQALPAGCCYLLATGRYKTNVAYAGALVKVTDTGTKGMPGAFGSTILLSNGSSINSYDSRKGEPKFFDKNAVVITNSEVRGAVQLKGGSQIEGSIAVGPNGSIETGTLTDRDTEGSNYTIWRNDRASYTSASLQTTPRTMAEVALPANPSTVDLAVTHKKPSLPVGNYDKVTVSNGAKVVLQPGVYIFDTLVLSSGGSIVLASPDKPVKIYIKSLLDINNGFSVSDPSVSPTLLQVNLARGAKYDQSGGSSLTGVVYGPGALIKLSNSADLYGAAVGADMTLNGSASIHYDEALSQYQLESGSSSGGTAGVTVLFRQRW